MQLSFVHLRVHSEYSIVDGLIRLKSLTSTIAQAGMRAVALTDETNLFATVKFYKAALSSGIKPIIGADLWLQNTNDAAQPYRFTVLCQNDTGYKNLRCLISRAYVDRLHHDKPVIDFSWLREFHEGLILLSGAREGDVGCALLANNISRAETLAKQWCELFPDRYYLELQRTGREHEELYTHAALQLARKLHIPVVATNDARFIKSDDFIAHEARVCIHEGYTLQEDTRKKSYSDQQYLRSTSEMCELFSDIPEALTNSVQIAKRCNVMLELNKNYLPNYPVPVGMTPENYLIEQAEQGLKNYFGLLQEVTDNKIPLSGITAIESIASPFEKGGQRGIFSLEEYKQRLQLELEVINAMGFAGYFLIVADFIHWAKTNGVMVGPGRGSGAGSLVAFVLQITTIDPLQYDLLFERFLNPERVSMPDFDIDFCMEGRDRVIEYVMQFYGRENVAQIITYGTMAAKAVVRDVGRVLAYPYGFVDQIAKLIPFELGMTLSKALEQEEILRQRYDQEDDVKALIDLALKLEGVARNAGKHAGGVVIAPSKLTDFAPLYCESVEDGIVTQFDKDDVEAVGLVKFDFLGLRTLTIIDWTLQTIENLEKGSGKINIERIPLDDPATYRLLKACNTTAVFQLESRGMKDLIHRLQPDCFEDIIALVALFRPGPLQSGMVDDFIDRKHGRATVVYPHPALEPILRPTYGVILYQEQVMQIAQVLAGYTLGGADLLRRAMGKKKPEEMAKQREFFLQGSIERGVEKHTASAIFDLMEKFAGYGFNKSHSAAYALIAYQTAWLKAHYPAAFMAAVLSSDMDNTDKVVGFIDECRTMGLRVLPPHLNHSQYRFTVADEQSIMYGLGAIKGAGEAAIEALIATRNAQGEFKHLFDFCQRVELRKLNRRMMEALMRSGAMDGLGPDRAVLMASLDLALKAAGQHETNRLRGQDDLFASLMDTPELSETNHQFVIAAPWSDTERLQGEKDTLGLYLTGHPVQAYADELQHIVNTPLSKVKVSERLNQSVRVAGLIEIIRTKITKRGDRIAFITVDDGTARAEICVFSEVHKQARDLLIKSNLVIVDVEVVYDEFTSGVRLISQHIHTLDDFRVNYARSLLIDVNEADCSPQFFDQLKQCLKGFVGGKCPVYLNYSKQTAAATLALGESWQVRPEKDLLAQLRAWLGEKRARFVY